MTPIVTLTTDFGVTDPYVAMMKAVILGYHRECSLVDITHGVAPQSIIQAQWILKNTWHFFPPGTVHLAVVDPGVGTDRTRLLVEYEEHVFVGPDNGLFSFISPEKAKIWGLRPSSGTNASRTFEGRDVFAHAVGKVLTGTPKDAFADTKTTWVRTPVPVATFDAESIQGQIIYYDHFGNAITNIERIHYPWGQDVEVKVGERTIYGIVGTYQESKAGSLIALWNSFGLLEIAQSMGSARNALNLDLGSEVVIKGERNGRRT